MKEREESSSFYSVQRRKIRNLKLLVKGKLDALRAAPWNKVLKELQ